MRNEDANAVSSGSERHTRRRVRVADARKKAARDKIATFLHSQKYREARVECGPSSEDSEDRGVTLNLFMDHEGDWVIFDEQGFAIRHDEGVDLISPDQLADIATKADLAVSEPWANDLVDQVCDVVGRRDRIKEREARRIANEAREAARRRNK